MSPEELLELTDDAFAVFAADATLLAVSPIFRRLFQPIDAFLARGTPWTMIMTEAVRHDLLSPDTAHRLSLIEESLTDQNAAIRGLDAETPNGVMHFSFKATSDGGFAFKVERESAEVATDERELEQIMSKVLEACPTCLTMARIGDGQILYRSPEATALLGKGFNSRAHFLHREERADFVTALLPSARVDDMRFTGRRPDGSPFPASISARLIDYRGEDVIVSSIIDLTDELAIMAELDRQRKQVFQSEKMSALGELLAGVAHELNNPLSIVVGNAQMLLEDDIKGPSQKRVAKLCDAAERCVGIVRAFLSMARDRPLRIEPVSAFDLLQTAREAFEANEHADIAIKIECAPSLPDLLVDEVQIVQVLSNLMTNAEQALRGNSSGRIELRAEAAPQNGYLRLRVSDNGPGIPQDVAPRIFDPLFTTKEIGKGTGIGLALCHRIVLAHSGSIELDPQSKEGASFIIDLPALPED